MEHSQRYQGLRRSYPFLSYESYQIIPHPEGIHISYVFNLSGKHTFKPTLFIPVRNFYRDIRHTCDDPNFRDLVFQLGMIEVISYWKAACPPLLIVTAGPLSEKTKEWWLKLYYKGLGEFFYKNGIEARQEDFLVIEASRAAIEKTGQAPLKDGFLVPVGGGKDSAVSLEILKRHYPVIPFLLNPRQAILGTIEQAGFHEKDSVVFHRSIDPLLLQLNQEGFLNGHTPFSALLAFQTLLASYLTGFRFVALSNEASANESTIPGTWINHQYSKTFEFESDFRSYCEKVLHSSSSYFSFLRPLSELQIARIFSSFPKYFNDFKSCNVGSKTDIWCGRCPKCLFAYLMLAPFLCKEEMVRIFGSDLLSSEDQWQNLLQLAGEAEEKPFECIGTIDEVNTALSMLIRRYASEKMPLLLAKYKGTTTFRRYATADPEYLLNSWNQDHFLTTELENTLRKYAGI